MNSLKKGEGVPLLNFEGGPGIPLLNFEGDPGVPLLNFEGGPGSRVPGLGSWSHFYTMPVPKSIVHMMKMTIFNSIEHTLMELFGKI